MRRTTSLILGLAAAALMLGWGVAAQAEVNVLVNVDKDKDVFVQENVFVDKDIDIDVDVMEQPDSVAEQGVYKNQDNGGNMIDVSDGESTALIDNAVVSANGVILINQAPGYANNQGNEIGISYGRGSVSGPDAGDTFAHAQTSVDQLNVENFVSDDTNVNQNTITMNAFSEGTGVVGVNQSAGNVNNQNNALAMSLADNAIIALGETDLGQFNVENEITSNSNRFDTINMGAFDGFDGVAMVNQSSGSGNNQANSVNIAADVDLTTLTAFSPTP